MPLATVTSSQSTVVILGAGDYRCPTSTGTALSAALPSVMVFQEDAPLATAVESPSATVSRILTTRCAISVHVPLWATLVVVVRSQQANGTKKSFAPGYVPCRLAADVSLDSGMTSSLPIARRNKTKIRLTALAV